MNERRVLCFCVNDSNSMVVFVIICENFGGDGLKAWWWWCIFSPSFLLLFFYFWLVQMDFVPLSTQEVNQLVRKGKWHCLKHDPILRITTSKHYLEMTIGVSLASLLLELDPFYFRMQICVV